MRILMTADAVGGVWTYAIELIRALGVFDIDVIMATMGVLPTPQQLDELDDISNLTLCTSDFKLEWMNSPWQDVDLAGEWLLRLEEEYKPDIIHLNGYVHGSLQWKAPVLVVGHSCVLSWWRAVKGEPAPSEWNEYHRRVFQGLHSAYVVASPTKAMLDALEDHYGTFKKIKVVPNGRDPSSFYCSSEKEPFIFTAGRLWDEAKNIAAVKKAALKLKWPVFVAGDNANSDCSVQNDNNIRFLGQLAPRSLPDWFSRASIYVLPARYEPFGLSALEAALSGCALVLGDIPSLREVWGDAALFVQPNDVDELIKVVKSLIESRPLLDYYSERAYQHSLNYLPEFMAQGYVEIYQELKQISNEYAEVKESCR